MGQTTSTVKNTNENSNVIDQERRPSFDETQYSVSPFKMYGIHSPSATSNTTNQIHHTLNNIKDIESINQRNLANAIPTIFHWNYPGQKVYITGSFNNWQGKIALKKEKLPPSYQSNETNVLSERFTLVMDLIPGFYQYKFIVDDEWTHAPDQDTISDPQNSILKNNIIQVSAPNKDHSESQLEDMADYSNTIPDIDYYNVYPPLIPPHLGYNHLDHPPPSYDPYHLPKPPLHVHINHLYGCTRQKHNECLVLGITQRYKNKFVTTLFYTPYSRPSPSQSLSSISLHQHNRPKQQNTNSHTKSLQSNSQNEQNSNLLSAFLRNKGTQVGS